MSITGEISLLSPLSSEQIDLLKSAKITGQRVPSPGDEKIDVPHEPEQIRNRVESLKKCQIQVLEHEIESGIQGMSCVACAANIRQLLNEIPGVLAADINYATHQAMVRYLPEMTEISSMRSVIKKVGYDFILPTTEDGIEDNNTPNADHTGSQMDWIPIIIAAVLMTGGMLFMHAPGARIAMFILSTPVIFYYGAPFFKHAFTLIKSGKSNMDTLVAMSTGIAWLFSTVNTFYPNVWTSQGLRAPIYFEAATSVIAFILLGKRLEDRARKKADAAIQNLIQLQPDTAFVKQEDGSFQVQPIHSIFPGQVLRCVRGDSFAVDGKIIKGEGFVDESSLTGEPNPIHKKAGSKVFAGSVNTDAVFEYIAESVGSQSALGKMIRSVRKAQASAQSTPLRKYMDEITSYFVPAVFIVALISAGIWMYFDQIPYAIHAFISVLIIACPCAMGLAIPTAIVNASGRGAKEGIIIRNAAGMEALRNVDILVLDKTGTITEGRPTVEEIHYRNADEQEKMRSYISALSGQSNHPLSKAIREMLAESTIQLTDIKQIPGKGMEARLGENILRFGSVTFCTDAVTNESDWIKPLLKEIDENGKAVVCMKLNSTVEAVVVLRDSVKSGSRQAIQRIERMGKRVWMLTGDHYSAAKKIAAETDIENYRAELLPEMKADIIRDFQKEGLRVGMVGDGINDAGALAVADVSIAMGQGADISIEVADMTLLQSDPEKIPDAIRLSQITHQIIRQNLFWAFIYNLVAIPVAAGILYPISHTLLSPVLAGAAMSLSSLTVVFNSLRIRNKKLDQ